MDHAEALGVRRDPSGRIEPGALDIEERVLPAQLVALGSQLLDVIAGHRKRRGLGHIDEREREAKDDPGDGEPEDADVPRGGSNSGNGRSDNDSARARSAAQGDGRDSASGAAGFARRGRAPFKGRRNKPDRLRGDHGTSFSATRSLALRARGLRIISPSDAINGRRETTRKPAR
jgi:hypothetical protein